jgi:hypothetical protein
MRKKAAAQFCGECGYELAPDSTGECPMCARFAQFRSEVTVPRRGELASGSALPPLADATMEAPAADMAIESPAPPKQESTARRKIRPTPSRTREGARSLSAAAKGDMALPAPDADRVMAAQAVPHHAVSSGEGYPWRTAIWVAVAGAIVAASVALFQSLVR